MLDSTMDSSDDPSGPSLPFPIFQISSTIARFLLYDIDTITWLRKTHNILGVLIGTLPQFPQQNVFLGLPLELQPEEARLLVEKELAYIVDDLHWHSTGMQSMTHNQKIAFVTDLERQGKEAAKAADMKRDAGRAKTMKRLQDGNRVSRGEKPDTGSEPTADGEHQEDSLFNQTSISDSMLISSSPVSKLSNPQDAWSITPATSFFLLQTPNVDPAVRLPTVRPSSYALFKHLHGLSYFMSPGLRFGCQFLVYPGDPLRFHSHFLAVAGGWDEEIDLLDLVGGGRLGTGVKKGWLIGGAKQQESDTPSGDGGERLDTMKTKHTGSANGEVRTFCIEWGGM